MNDQNACKHLDDIREITTSRNHVCEECVKIGGRWVHLRTCQTCGITLCCDNSPNLHMTKHYHHTHHPVVASAEPGESWLWCYIDELMMEY